MPNFSGGGILPAMAWENLRDRLRHYMEHHADGSRREPLFNQKSLAVAAGLHDTAVRDILKGRSRKPSAQTLNAIAETLGVDLSVLVNKSVDINHLSQKVSHPAGGSFNPRKDGENMKSLRMRIAVEIGQLPETQLPVVEQFIEMLQNIGGDQATRPQKPGKTG